jgi:phosphatidylglycerophosphatase C
MTNAQSDARTIAAFDFDGTIVRRDSLLPFLRRVCGAGPVARAVAAEAPAIARVAAGGGDRDLVKAGLFARLLAGRSVEALEPVITAYAELVATRRVRPDMRARIGWHRGAGHALVIVSASPEIYLTPIGRLLGFDAVLGTRLEVDAAGVLTGSMDGPNVRGPEKVARLRAHAGDGPLRIWAYGDSAGDRELLALADIGTRVTWRRLRAGGGTPKRTS